MGTTSTVVVLDHPEYGKPKLQGKGRVRSIGVCLAWRFYYIDRLVGPKELDAQVLAWSREGRAVIAYFVEDSDLAYIVGAKGGEHGFRLLINPSMASMYVEGSEALEVLKERGEQFNELGANDLAKWSSNVPVRVRVDEISTTVRRNWVFAEEGARRLLELMGLIYPK